MCRQYNRFFIFTLALFFGVSCTFNGECTDSQLQRTNMKSLVLEFLDIPVQSFNSCLVLDPIQYSSVFQRYICNHFLLQSHMRMRRSVYIYTAYHSSKAHRFRRRYIRNRTTASQRDYLIYGRQKMEVFTTTPSHRQHTILTRDPTTARRHAFFSPSPRCANVVFNYSVFPSTDTLSLQRSLELSVKRHIHSKPCRCLYPYLQQQHSCVQEVQGFII